MQVLLTRAQRFPSNIKLGTAPTALRNEVTKLQRRFKLGRLLTNILANYRKFKKKNLYQQLEKYDFPKNFVT